MPRTAAYRRHLKRRGPGPGQAIRIVADSRYTGRCPTCHAIVTWATALPIRVPIALHHDPPPRLIEHDPDIGTIDVIALSDLHAAHCPLVLLAPPPPSRKPSG